VDNLQRRGHPPADTGRHRGGSLPGHYFPWNGPSRTPPTLPSPGHVLNPGWHWREFLPDVTCEACWRIGHQAVNCDMLAMAPCLERYMKGHLTNSTWDSIEADWVNQWKDCLDNPCQKPYQVMLAYLDNLNMLVDLLDAQFDWACWEIYKDSNALSK
jgi:hypothetical protein